MLSNEKTQSQELIDLTVTNCIHLLSKVFVSWNLTQRIRSTTGTMSRPDLSNQFGNLPSAVVT